MRPPEARANSRSAGPPAGSDPFDRLPIGHVKLIAQPDQHAGGVQRADADQRLLLPAERERIERHPAVIMDPQVLDGGLRVDEPTAEDSEVDVVLRVLVVRVHRKLQEVVGSNETEIG